MRKDAPPGTANQELLDALTRHQIFLLGHAGWWVNQTGKTLSKDEAKLEKTILDFKVAIASKKASPKIPELLKRIGKIRERSWQKISKDWQTYGDNLVKSETVYLGKILKKTIPVIFDPVFPSKTQIRAAAVSEPFQGKILEKWIETLAVNDVKRVKAYVARAFAEGKSIEEIARGIQEIVGNIQRRETRAVARTAVSHMSNQAKEIMAKANADILSKVIFVATLDSGTTIVCCANDGKIFRIGEGPKLPLHFACRSMKVPIISAERYGTRPMKEISQREILDKFAKEHGLKGKIRRKDIPHGLKGKFDLFAREEMKKFTGTVSAKETYESFLRRQSVAFQNEVLGVKRAKLFRTGEVSLSKFVNRRGDAVIPLDELYKKEKSLFEEANISVK